MSRAGSAICPIRNCARIEGTGVENLAQIYTQLKYTRESHQEYSQTVLDYLAAQDFLN